MADNTITSIRIPTELYERIQKDAERDKRSVTKQIEFMITKYYEIQNMTQSR